MFMRAPFAGCLAGQDARRLLDQLTIALRTAAGCGSMRLEEGAVDPRHTQGLAINLSSQAEEAEASTLHTPQRFTSDEESGARDTERALLEYTLVPECDLRNQELAPSYGFNSDVRRPLTERQAFILPNAAAVLMFGPVAQIFLVNSEAQSRQRRALELTETSNAKRGHRLRSPQRGRGAETSNMLTTGRRPLRPAERKPGPSWAGPPLGGARGRPCRSTAADGYLRNMVITETGVG
ncbi:uncharacterized protein THITE_2129654 [Thermothielavioides terrestris NRRL 8126]|uniref:Uncharacterized protein n=1 Tax=Thermothielavioides terrestris (strain ATCC 38088 / NRRL 8126) TaxID=578455 RepID=G2R7B1_THETT|nr:uncharacterized protein THITE_2129654 [Thermothielavioides terrestris NRRL 8126]AEO67820.1 hypothetical protein THITE_2129654 [Thermothielavioides terrestris NRRL 8126]